MTGSTSRRYAGFIACAALGLALLVTAGCGNETAEKPATTSATDTALRGLPIAESALETMAPDAKLLVVTTPEAVTSTATPVWGYLFGSPKTDGTYIVYVRGGAVMDAAEYGEAGLDEKQWSEVPDTTDWKIDSNEAYDKAVSASGAEGTPPYYMGLQTYVPKSETDTQTAEPFVWYVYLNENQQAPIQVNATSGEVVAK